MVRSTIDISQGVLAFLGITLGVVPLLMRLFSGETGSLWQLLPGSGAGAPAVVAAVAVLAVTAVGVLVLERRK